ncbi:hypothetical protein, partial [Oceanivirga salmonicida]
QYIDKYSICYTSFNPYLEMYYADNVAYINLSYYGINISENMNKELVLSYILILSKISYELLTTPLNLSLDNKVYSISKWEYKSRYCNDYVYIFKSCISECFPASVIYFERDINTFIVFLDYDDNLENRDLMNEIISYFLPLDYEIEYFFEHFYMLNIKKLEKLGRWLLL